MELDFAGLAGTLTLPAEGSSPFPVVLLLTGSGPIDRDSNHRKIRFDATAQLADALAGIGVASFRYDKRGVGVSPGDWRASGFWDSVDDAAAVLEMLRGRPEVDLSRIVVAGHSEGAVQAVALGGRDRGIAGLVLLAGSARSGEEVLRWQARTIIPTLPRPVRLLLRVLRIDPVKKVRANHAKLKATTTDVARLGLAKVNAKWFREFMVDDLAKIEVPVLAVPGEGPPGRPRRPCRDRGRGSGAGRDPRRARPDPLAAAAARSAVALALQAGGGSRSTQRWSRWCSTGSGGRSSDSSSQALPPGICTEPSHVLPAS